MPFNYYRICLSNAYCNFLSEFIEETQIKSVTLLKQFRQWERGSWIKKEKKNQEQC